MTAEINAFSVSDEMLRVMWQTGRQQVDCSRVVGQQQQKSDHRVTRRHVCTIRTVLVSRGQFRNVEFMGRIRPEGLRERQTPSV